VQEKLLSGILEHCVSRFADFDRYVIWLNTAFTPTGT
jgi:hypothetical protein